MIKETDEILLKRYLLGELPPDECLAVDARLFLEPEFSELFDIVEEELVDDFISNDLTPTERHALETNHLATPEGRQTLQLAEAFQEGLASPKEMKSTSGESSTWRDRWFGGSQAWWSAPLAVTALLLLIVGGWLVLRAILTARHAAPPTEVRQIPPPTNPEPLPVPVNSPPGNSNETVHQQKPPIPVSSPPHSLKPEKPESPLLAMFSLSPQGVLRESGEFPNPVELGKATELGFQLPLVDDVESGLFRATLSQYHGVFINSWSNLAAVNGKSGKVVEVRIPAKLIPPRKYQIKLDAVAPDSKITEIRTYYFNTR